MEALFACTKCHNRVPFEELSDVEQLCKECRTTYPVVKCTYCRSEFEQKGGSGTVCRRCEKNVKAYGKPSACEYCRVVAAFVGRKCQRCSHSEKKYGPPQTCGQCKQRCAFVRKDDPNRQPGKVLCYLCVMAHKRVLAKAKSKDKTASGECSRNNSGEKKDSPSVKKDGSSKPVPSGQSWDRDSSNGSSGGNHKMGSTTSSKSEQQEKSSSAPSTPTPSKSQKHKADSTDKGGDQPDTVTKKPKLEKSASAANGLSLLGSESPFSDSDNMVAMTHLKEEVESLKKVVASKDLQILERDKKITELKAQHYESDKDFRTRLTSMQKKHSQDVENLQTKNRELLKQVSALARSSKKSTDSPLT